MNNSNFITIQGWMVNELNLKGNELLVYAIIYGFCQDEESKFQGNRRYLAEWCNASLPSVDLALKKLIEKQLVIKEILEINNVKFNTYKINFEILENFTGSKETLQGVVKKLYRGSKETLYNNNIYNNNIKKEKDKKEKNVDELIDERIVDEELKQTIYDFIKMRKIIKRPMTTRAVSDLLKKLNRLSDNIDEQKLILEKSILNCWQDIYQLKDDEKIKIEKEKKKDKDTFTYVFTGKETDDEYRECLKLGSIDKEKFKEKLFELEKEGKVKIERNI